MPATDADIRRSNGRRIEAARLTQGLTQAQLAERITAAGYPTTFQSVSTWERGESMPKPAGMVALAAALGYRVGELFNFDAILPPPGEVA